METYGLEKLGLVNAGAVYRNLTPAQLVEHALRRGEGTLSNTGALMVKTGKYTGRSANDKFIVDTPAVHDDIAWGKVNRPIEKAKFDAIRAKVLAYLQGRDVFIFDGFAGADPKYTKAFRIVNELASQNLFIHQLLRRPTAEQLEDFHEDYTIIAAPNFKCIPEIRIFGAVRRIHAAVHHGIYFFITGQWFTAGSVIISNRIADSGILDIFDRCHDIAYHACTKFLTGDKLSCPKISYFNNLCRKSGCHHTDLCAFLYASVHNTAEYNNALISIIN